MSGSEHANTAPLRVLLRDATRPAHERLHTHDGFAAVKTMTIDLAAYRTLLGRLYGFHVPFHTIAGCGPERCQWLAEDLRALRPDRLPDGAGLEVAMCQRLPVLDSPARRLGAAYVIEGSALGGRELARGLDHLLGADGVRGRLFFLGGGADKGAGWRDTLAQLAAVPPDQALRAEVVSAAADTFAAFEAWMTGWRGTTDA